MGSWTRLSATGTQPSFLGRRPSREDSQAGRAPSFARALSASLTPSTHPVEWLLTSAGRQDCGKVWAFLFCFNGEDFTHHHGQVAQCHEAHREPSHGCAQPPTARGSLPHCRTLAQPSWLNRDPGHRHHAISFLHPRRGFFFSFFNITMRPSRLNKCMYLIILNNSCPHLPQLSASCLHSDTQTEPPAPRSCSAGLGGRRPETAYSNKVPGLRTRSVWKPLPSGSLRPTARGE